MRIRVWQSVFYDGSCIGRNGVHHMGNHTHLCGGIRLDYLGGGAFQTQKKDKIAGGINKFRKIKLGERAVI